MIFRIFAAATFLLLAASCSQNSASPETYTENSADTLRALAQERSSEKTWAAELEGERLKNSLNANIDNQAGVPINIETASLIFESAQIYPTIPDFGNLDTSVLSDEINFLVADFCSAILAKKDFAGCKDFFVDSNLFLLALFLSDISAFDAKSYIVGSPFFVDDNFEIPVRFLCKDNFFDCSIFINAQDGSKINQVRLSRK